MLPTLPYHGLIREYHKQLAPSLSHHQKGAVLPVLLPLAALELSSIFQEHIGNLSVRALFDRVIHSIWIEGVAL